ncbi:retrovirus-related pol polyprotein from transposon TNT 1-94, partial [Tanacetum coccineum]
DEQEVSDDKEETQVKVLIALADDEISTGKNHARNDEWIDITMKKCRDDLLALKQAKLEAVTFQVQNNELTKLNHALQDELKEERKGASPSSEVMTLTYQDHSLRERSGLGTMKHTKPETQKYSNKSVLGLVIVSDTEPVTSLVPTKVKTNDQESKIDDLTKLVQMLMDENINSTLRNLNLILYYMKCKKEDHRTSDHDMYISSLKCSQNYKAQPYKYASPSKQILKSKAKPYLPCTYCSFNDHRPDDCRNYPECGICGSCDHFTLGHNRVILVRRGVLAESSQSSEFVIGQGTIFNANKEIVLIAPRRNDVYVLDMSLLTPNGVCFFAKASESVNWLWINHVLHVKKESIKEPLLKLNKTSLLRKKCLCLLHMDLFGPVSPMSINHEKYTLFIVDKYSRSIIVKRHDKTPYEIFRERIPHTSYFHVFGCPVFIHNHKDHLVKFDVKADDGYFLGYSFNSKAFKVFNTRRQQIKETNHVTFDESIESIRFTNTSVYQIGIDDSSRYPPDEFAQEDDPSRQYQSNFDFSYFIIPHGHSLTELTQENHVPKACSFMLCDLDFEPSSLSLSSMPSCDLECLTNILILCLILKASNQSLRKSLSLNLELS